MATGQRKGSVWLSVLGSRLSVILCFYDHVGRAGGRAGVIGRLWPYGNREVGKLPSSHLECSLL